MFHLIALEPGASPKGPAVDLLAVLNDYGAEDLVKIICNLALTEMNSKKRLGESGAHVLAAAMTHRQTKVRITDMKSPYYDQVGEIIFAEGEDLYVWMTGATRQFHMGQIEPVPL